MANDISFGLNLGANEGRAEFCAALMRTGSADPRKSARQGSKVANKGAYIDVSDRNLQPQLMQ